MGLFAQQGSVSGYVFDGDKAIPYASIALKNTLFGTASNDSGYFEINNVPFADYELLVSHISYQGHKQSLLLNENQIKSELNIKLIPLTSELDQVVISATRTNKKQTDSPVIVNILSSKTIDAVQACSVSEGLRFQPGLRVETDCQTCNYTQLRMNGLSGSYSQILINGRPIFSPLTGLYGLEQLPTNMLDRIEVVRGGGSALYGSNAIGGTVNIITKTPVKNAYDVRYTAQNVNGASSDHILMGNASLVNKDASAGASIFVNYRDRESYDHNGDNFSELPELKNFSIGTNVFLLPTNNQKIELNLSYINEYRYGGEMIDSAAYLAQQAEERTHNVLMGGLDYQWNFNEDHSSFIAYSAGQLTTRDHYTGIMPDSTYELEEHYTLPPYGSSISSTFLVGSQLNHRFRNFLFGSNTFTLGGEYTFDKVYDEIESYQYLIDQTTQNVGFFLQSDWNILPPFTVLLGLRADQHNLVDHLILSPRISLLYKLKNTTQFRFTYGSGFRAPQAFDTDMHIAFAGGGISRISLSPDLKEERSKSLSTSVNYDKASKSFIYGFTAEFFYTKLLDAFYQHPIGEDQYGQQFEKRNGPGATVSGTTIELRANFNRKVQLEAGFTLQSSLFDEAVENIEGLEAKRAFLRSPNTYGYSTLIITPNEKFNASINMVYTGQMELAHIAGAPNQLNDEYINSPSFIELGFKVSYTFKLPKISSAIEIYTGVKNLTNAYQNDFDIGKNRDSNYVYGPGLPRTFFVGIRILSL